MMKIERIYTCLNRSTTELKLQSFEKERLATKLLLVNVESAFQNIEKEKRNVELLLANIELRFKNEEKENLTIQLLEANLELKRKEKIQLEQIDRLEKMIYMVSHEIRQPITQLLGLTSILKNLKTSKPIARLLEYISESITKLDAYTRSFTIYLSEMVHKSRGTK